MYSSPLINIVLDTGYEKFKKCVSTDCIIEAFPCINWYIPISSQTHTVARFYHHAYGLFRDKLEDSLKANQCFWPIQDYFLLHPTYRLSESCSRLQFLRKKLICEIWYISMNFSTFSFCVRKNKCAFSTRTSVLCKAAVDVRITIFCRWVSGPRPATSLLPSDFSFEEDLDSTSLELAF